MRDSRIRWRTPQHFIFSAAGRQLKEARLRYAALAQRSPHLLSRLAAARDMPRLAASRAHHEQ